MCIGIGYRIQDIDIVYDNNLITGLMNRALPLSSKFRDIKLSVAIT